MHQVTPELVLRELDRVLNDRELGLPSPWRIVLPEPAPDASLVPIEGVRSARG
jgi:heptosyltransferase-2